jgi:hypothetical protein
MQELVLIILCTTEFTDYFSKRIVLGRTQGGKIIDYEVVDGEDVGELDVESRFCARVQVIELVDIELRLSALYTYHCRHVRGASLVSKGELTVGPDFLHSIDGLRDIAVERLKVDILTTKKSAGCNLAEDLCDFSQIAVHERRKSSIYDAPMLRLKNSWLKICLPDPMARNLEEVLLRVIREL